MTAREPAYLTYLPLGKRMSHLVKRHRVVTVRGGWLCVDCETLWSGQGGPWSVMALTDLEGGHLRCWKEKHDGH